VKERLPELQILLSLSPLMPRVKKLGYEVFIKNKLIEFI
jgi:hypothetical protein